MKILGQKAYWIINKDLAKEVGIEGALLLSDLIDKQEYFKNKNEIDDEGFFYNTSEDIERDTTLSYKLQKKNLNILKEKGYIDIKLKGVPAKLHFKVNEDKILLFVNSSFTQKSKLDLPENQNKILLFVNSSFTQKSKLDLPKSKTNNNKEIKINNNNKEINNICAFFEKFWSLYPNKIDKQRALKSFERLDTQEKILAINGAEKWSEYWELDKIEKRFIPHPTTWLNNKRWEVEPPKAIEKIPANAFVEQPESFLDGFYK